MANLESPIYLCLNQNGFVPILRLSGQFTGQFTNHLLSSNFSNNEETSLLKLDNIGGSVKNTDVKVTHNNVTMNVKDIVIEKGGEKYNLDALLNKINLQQFSENYNTRDVLERPLFESSNKGDHKTLKKNPNYNEDHKEVLNINTQGSLYSKEESSYDNEIDFTGDIIAEEKDPLHGGTGHFSLTDGIQTSVLGAIDEEFIEYYKQH